jgi:hypothetical protein
MLRFVNKEDAKLFLPLAEAVNDCNPITRPLYPHVTIHPDRRMPETLPISTMDKAISCAVGVIKVISRSNAGYLVGFPLDEDELRPEIRYFKTTDVLDQHISLGFFAHSGGKPHYTETNVLAHLRAVYQDSHFDTIALDPVTNADKRILTGYDQVSAHDNPRFPVVEISDRPFADLGSFLY